MKFKWGPVEGYVCRYCGSQDMEGQRQGQFSYKSMLDGEWTETIVPARNLVFCMNCKSNYYSNQEE